AAPDDDAPRLVYADWLGERGDLRGELIAYQCQLARAPNPLRRQTLARQVRDLLKAHGDAWAAPVPEGSRRYRWVRGFIGTLSAPAPQLAPRAAELFGAHPIFDLEITGASDSDLSVIAQANLGPLRSLKLNGEATNLAMLLRAAPGLQTL